MAILLPFDFLEMTFMKNAFLGVIIAAPLLGLLSTMIVNQKMAFFSDAIGHSALTGIGIGVLVGIGSYTTSMILFSAILGGVMAYFSYKHPDTTDTVIGVFSAVAMAFGTMLLSRGGNFNQYTTVLIGDLLSITPTDLVLLLGVGSVLIAIWYLLFNQLVLTSLNTSLANSRKVQTLRVRMVFMIVVAVVVVLCIPWIGVLLINAFLILPAAASRHIATNMRQYEVYAVSIALVCGILGLGLAYAWGTSVGATIVVLMGGAYVFCYLCGHFIRR